jgi:hypothetical protein
VDLVPSANGLTAQVNSKKPGEKGSDVQVRVKRHGVLSKPFDIKVRAPDHLRPAPWGSTTSPDPKFGYSTEIYYEIFDQYDVILPRKVPFNEDFPEKSIVHLYGGGGKFQVAGSVYRHQLAA